MTPIHTVTRPLIEKLIQFNEYNEKEYQSY
jgi:hypothetical protein